jgi:hypothetical protein
MIMARNFDTLTSEIGLVVTKIVNTDLTLLRGYSQAKARAIASFTLLLGEGFASGSISEDQLRGIGDLLMATLRQVTGLPALSLAPSTGMVWGIGPAA